MRRKKHSQPRFNLKSPNILSEPSSIYLIFRYKTLPDGKKERLKYSTGKKVLPKFWLGDRAKESLHYPEAKELNRFLNRLKEEVLVIVEKNPFIDVNELKYKLDQYLGYVENTESTLPTLPEYIIENINKNKLDPRTIAKYRGVYNHLRKYESDCNQLLRFENISFQFKQDFIEWLYKNGVKSKNTVAKIFQIIKMFMADAFRERREIEYEKVRIHNNEIFKHPDFSVKRTKTSKHYLYLEEVEKLKGIDLSKYPHLNRVRNCFILCCYTGLRISDLRRLKPEHIITDANGDLFIDIHTFKGRDTKIDNQVIIPIFPALHRFLQNLDFQIPQPYSDQKQNSHLKELCKYTRLDRIVVNKESDKGKTKEMHIPLWQKVSNHTARYTFINIMLNDFDVSPNELMKITGQSLKTLMGYERGDKMRNARKVVAKVKPKLTTIRKITG